MTPVIVLDTGPLGLLTQRKGVVKADVCRHWYESLLAAGYRFAVPEIADYELRREHLRAEKWPSIDRLQKFIRLKGNLYLPITTPAMHQAAAFWAQARREGRPTAPDLALDGDAILAAQAVTYDPTPGGVLVATTNPDHLSRFVAAEEWSKIVP